MDFAIQNIIYNILQLKRAAKEDTEIFVTLKHNADLCPKLQHKLESVFSAFEKYQRIVYDIQGPRDQGSDVIIRQIINDETHFICFQIKSEVDLKDKSWLKNIKAQWVDSQNSYRNLLDYYIFLCCDSRDSETKNKIRLLESEFSSTKPVHIIEPEYALTFLKLSLMQTDAIIKAKLGSEDIVYRNGLSIVTDFTPTEDAILYYMIYQKIYEGSDSIDEITILDSEFIKYVYANTPDLNRDWFFEDEESTNDDFHQDYTIRELDTHERLSLDLEELKDLYILMSKSHGSYVNFLQVQPLVLLMMDGNERYGYTGDDLLFYMMALFGPYKGYTSP
jgi:hypothetical protein